MELLITLTFLSIALLALTSQFPSLSMSQITIDLDDTDTIYAGTGKTSSYRNEGGQAIVGVVNRGESNVEKRG